PAVPFLGFGGGLLGALLGFTGGAISGFLFLPLDTLLTLGFGLLGGDAASLGLLRLTALSVGLLALYGFAAQALKLGLFRLPLLGDGEVSPQTGHRAVLGERGIGLELLPA